MPSFEFPEDELPTGATTFATNASTPNPAPFSFATQDLDWDAASPLVTSDGLDRIKPPVGKLTRFALVRDHRPLSAQIHFAAIGNKTARSYICGGLGCSLCKSGDASRISVVALAVQYLNADTATGRAAESHDHYKVGFLQLSPTQFNDVKMSPPENVKPTDIDFLSTFDGRRYSYKAACSPPQYFRIGDAALVSGLAAPLLPKLKNKLGGVIPTGPIPDSDGKPF
jgi:hypothetical protein